jgi:hypothetical protein
MTDCSGIYGEPSGAMARWISSSSGAEIELAT